MFPHIYIYIFVQIKGKEKKKLLKGFFHHTPSALFNQTFPKCPSDRLQTRQSNFLFRRRSSVHLISRVSLVPWFRHMSTKLSGKFGIPRARGISCRFLLPLPSRRSIPYVCSNSKPHSFSRAIHPFSSLFFFFFPFLIARTGRGKGGGRSFFPFSFRFRAPSKLFQVPLLLRTWVFLSWILLFRNSNKAPVFGV